MPEWATTGALALGCFVALYMGRRALGSRTLHPLPPGPPGVPWVGNVIGIDTDAPWLTYAEWAKTYGNLVYSRLLGKDIVIINSEKIAKDLLEDRSRNYSDRPYLITNDLCGIHFNTVLLPYGDRWRLHRRFFHQTFRMEAVHRFLPYQHRRGCILLRRLLEMPEKLNDHVFEYTTAVILNSVYNYDPASRKDDLVDMVEKALSTILAVVRPDIAAIVNAFQWLLYLPSWFPGMTFKKKMAVARVFSERYAEQPFRYSLEKEASGNVAPSMVYDALQYMSSKGTLTEESWMEELKGASAAAFLAASETSNSFLMAFFLMMLLNPEVQEKAQAQIDAVVGKDRLPTIADRPLLPFIDAIFWETLRYSPITPLSVPHAAVHDDVYDGFHIPKGAIILVNLWSITHDESKYPNPHKFIPERFLNGDGSLKLNDAKHIAFGFGRRICVGRHFADTSIWSVMAKVLAVFKILKPLDENGVEIPVEPKFSTGLVIHPLPFKYRIIPRFLETDAKKLEQLITASTA